MATETTLRKKPYGLGYGPEGILPVPGGVPSLRNMPAMPSMPAVGAALGIGAPVAYAQPVYQPSGVPAIHQPPGAPPGPPAGMPAQMGSAPRTGYPQPSYEPQGIPAATAPAAPGPTMAARMGIGTPVGYPQPTYGQPANLPQQFTPPTPVTPAAVATAAPAATAEPARPALSPPPAPAAPLDPQAAADRATLGRGWDAVKDANNRAGAAILDVATMVPRGVLGAYDSSVIRGARAMGIPAAYTSPLLLPKGGDPGSLTPFYDEIRQRDAAAAGAQAQAKPAPAGIVSPAAAATLPATTAALQLPATPAVPASRAQVQAMDNDPANAAALAAAQTAPALYETQQRTPAATAVAAPAPEAVAPAGARLGQPVSDAERQLANIAASNRDLESRQRPGGPSIIGPVDYANRNAAFNDEAALRTAASQGSWSPRRGYAGNEGAVRAALAPIAARARLGEVAAHNASNETIAGQREAGEAARATLRDTGETTRAGIRESGEIARAMATDNIRRSEVDIHRGELGLRQQAAVYDNATKARIEAAQNAVTNATTPEARRLAAETLATLTGRVHPESFKAITVGGGSVTDPVTGVAVAQPQRALVLNTATGKYEEIGGAAGGATKPAAAIPEGAISTVNGKRARRVNGEWVPF